MSPSWPLEAEGVWIEVRCPRRAVPCDVLFLDRDGVVIEDHNYVHDPSDVALVPGAAMLIAAANTAAVPVGIVTNQAGIDRGLYDWDGFAAVTRRIDELLARHGARIDAVAAAPFHPDFTKGYGAAQARWRKPGPQMILTLAERINAAPARSWMVGDKDIDMRAAEAAGLAGAILVDQATDLFQVRTKLKGLLRE